MSHLRQITDHSRATLRSHEAQTAVAIELAHQQALTSIQPSLDRLREEMVSTQRDDGKISLIWLYHNQRQGHIKQFIADQINHFGQITKTLVSHAKQFAAQFGMQYAWTLLTAMAPDKTTRVPPPPDIVATAQDASQMADLFDGLGREAAEEAGKALVTGITLSRDLREIVRDMQNALGIARNRALTINRDQIHTAYRRALLEVYKANSGTVEGWIWSAVRDTHTCIVCILMDGTFHPLSEAFEGHVGDRCTPIPKIRGAIPEQIQPGADWFAQQSTDVQRKILGGAKYTAYKDGAITLQDLIRHGHDPKWGGYRQEKSLKEAIGAKKAAHYYGK